MRFFSLDKNLQLELGCCMLAGRDEDTLESCFQTAFRRHYILSVRQKIDTGTGNR